MFTANTEKNMHGKLPDKLSLNMRNKNGMLICGGAFPDRNFLEWLYILTYFR